MPTFSQVRIHILPRFYPGSNSGHLVGKVAFGNQVLAFGSDDWGQCRVPELQAGGEVRTFERHPFGFGGFLQMFPILSRKLPKKQVESKWTVCDENLFS